MLKTGAGRSPGEAEQILPTAREGRTQRVVGSGVYHGSGSRNSKCYCSGYGRWQGRAPDTEGAGMHTLPMCWTLGSLE